MQRLACRDHMRRELPGGTLIGAPSMVGKSGATNGLRLRGCTVMRWWDWGVRPWSVLTIEGRTPEERPSDYFPFASGLNGTTTGRGSASAPEYFEPSGSFASARPSVSDSQIWDSRYSFS
jgi:hypothetical protein